MGGEGTVDCRSAIPSNPTVFAVPRGSGHRPSVLIIGGHFCSTPTLEQSAISRTWCIRWSALLGMAWKKRSQQSIFAGTVRP